MKITKENRSSFVPKVGMKVKIRCWDDMAEEFGVSDWSGIKTTALDGSEVSFVPAMREFCGKVYAISHLRQPRAFRLDGVDNWSFVPSMIDEIIDERKQGDIVDGKLFLGVDDEGNDLFWGDEVLVWDVDSESRKERKIIAVGGGGYEAENTNSIRYHFWSHCLKKPEEQKKIMKRMTVRQAWEFCKAHNYDLIYMASRGDRWYVSSFSGYDSERLDETINVEFAYTPDCGKTIVEFPEVSE